jgi:polysaccharide export outer membrane protein
MNGSQPQIILLTTFSLLNIGHMGVAFAEVGNPSLQSNPTIAEPQKTLRSPLPSSAPESIQTDSPTKPATPASGINSQLGKPAIRAEPYTLGTGDRIAVTIANVPEFSGQYQIQVDGTVDVPVIGSVSVWGLTVRQAATLLTERYTRAEVLRDPSITVSLLVINQLRIALSGEVNRPGSYNIAPSDGKLPTLTEAIQRAGGITELADLRRVKLVRSRRSGVDETFQIDLWELLQSGDLRQDITLRDGDSIVLTKATTPINSAEAGLLGAATVSPAFIQVGILGETRQSGVIQVPPNTPLNQAILAAGGFSNRARKGSVDLIRLNRDGTVSRRTIAIDFSKGIDEAANPILRNRDVVLVGRNFIAALSDNLTAILGPVNQAFSVFTLFKALFPANSSSNSSIIIPTGSTTTNSPTPASTPR